MRATNDRNGADVVSLDITYRWAGKFHVEPLTGQVVDCEKASIDTEGPLIRLAVTFQGTQEVLFVPLMQHLHLAVRIIGQVERVCIFTSGTAIKAVQLYGNFYGCTASHAEALRAWGADPLQYQPFPS